MINSDNWAAFYQLKSLLNDYSLKNNKLNHYSSKPLPENFKQISGWYKMINPRDEISRYRTNLMNIEHVWSIDNTFYHSPLFASWASGNFAVKQNLLADYWSGLPSVAIVKDPIAGEVLQMGRDTYQRIPTYQFVTAISLVCLWILLMLINVLFTFFWIPRLIMKKVSVGASIAIRIWPVIASLIVIIVIVLGEGGNDFNKWAKPTTTSIAVFVCTLAYAIISIGSLWLCIRHYKTPMNQFVYWHSSLLSLLHVLVVIYLLNYGIIGIRTWAY